jgi:hypothetical protein
VLDLGWPGPSQSDQSVFSATLLDAAERRKIARFELTLTAVTPDEISRFLAAVVLVLPSCQITTGGELKVGSQTEVHASTEQCLTALQGVPTCHPSSDRHPHRDRRGGCRGRWNRPGERLDRQSASANAPDGPVRTGGGTFELSLRRGCLARVHLL